MVHFLVVPPFPRRLGSQGGPVSGGARTRERQPASPTASPALVVLVLCSAVYIVNSHLLVQAFRPARLPTKQPPKRSGQSLTPRPSLPPSPILLLPTTVRPSRPKMLIIGLTGGIATGKSTVSAILSAPPYNLPIIDADLLARKVVEPGTTGYRQIVEYFGPTTPDLLLPPSSPDTDSAQNTNNNDGGKQQQQEKEKGRGEEEEESPRPLNRAALGRRVFGDSPAARAARAKLNSIIHPLVRRAAYRALLRAYLRGHWAVVWDVPLLFEVGTDRLCGAVVVVGVRDPAVQMARLRARDPHLSAAEAEDRVRSQADVRAKARRCEARGPGRGVVVWNDGDREELRREVGRVVGGLRRGSPWWWGWVLWVCPPLAVGVGAWEVFVNWRGARRWEREEARERARL